MSDSESWFKVGYFALSTSIVSYYQYNRKKKARIQSAMFKKLWSRELIVCWTWNRKFSNEISWYSQNDTNCFLKWRWRTWYKTLTKEYALCTTPLFECNAQFRFLLVQVILFLLLHVTKVSQNRRRIHWFCLQIIEFVSYGTRPGALIRIPFKPPI